MTMAQVANAVTRFTSRVVATNLGPSFDDFILPRASRAWRKRSRAAEGSADDIVKKMLDNEGYRELYLKAKGGYFRSKRHVKLYIDEHSMIKK